jgi:hypothetical protein
MNLERRIQLEKRIARRVVRDLLAAGYVITVNNGGDENEIPYSQDYSEIIKAMFATDEEHLITRIPYEFGGTVRIKESFVFFVYGNDGWDVVNDYGTSLEPVMEPINRWCDQLQEAK